VSNTSAIKKRGVRDPRKAPFIFLFLLPAFLFLIVFMYYPIEETVRLSFTKTQGLGASVPAGLENYQKLFASDEFLQGLFHVFLWAFWSIIIQIPLAFLVAFSLTYYGNKLTGPLRSIFYLSNVLPSAITAMLGKFIFAPRYGIIASLSTALGLKTLGSVDFLGDPRLAFWSLFAIATWAYTGFPIIYLMARIEQIPTEIREAAELDGASSWRYARSIVLPDLSFPIRILMVLCTVGSIKLFDLPKMMTSGGPGYSTVTLGITLYNQGFVNWNYGSASAIGVVIFILSLIFTVIQFTFGTKQEKAR
jgi:ABC-type sugar transport system permease subunit